MLIDLKSLKVLYVEDDPMTREEILFSLTTFVDTIYTAENGEIGKELFYSHLPDLIITDIQMPVMDGLSMISAIKQTHPKIPVIIMTAFNDTSYLFKAIELGITHYVTKPVNLKNLLSKIDEIAEQIILKKKALWQEKLLSQYKNAIDETMAVSKTDALGIITYVNEKFCTLSGYTYDEIIGNSHALFRSLREKNEKFHALWEMISKGEQWHGVIENRAKNGDHFILDQTIFPLYDADNTIIEYIAIGDDVTELFHYRDFLEIELHRNRKSLDETLHFLEQYQEALQVGTAVCHMSLEGKILDANETFCQLLGYTKDSILKIEECAICQCEGFDIRSIHETLKKENVYKHEFQFRTREGSFKTFDSIFVPISDTNGAIVEILSMHHNITDLLELNKEIITTQHEVLTVLGEAAENKSAETGSHVKRVAAYSRFLADKYGLSDEEARLIEMVAPMHDIGKIAIPDSILHKPGKLSAEEMEIMKTHAYKGYQMLSHSERPLMKHAALIALQHHEKYDGSGYPSGLVGEDIHIAGRIVAIADVFDSLGSKRSYKEAWALEQIVEYFKEQRGCHFDPVLVDILLDNLDEIILINTRIQD
ncbi:MAG: response regulator [Sulfuricurvum sp.]|uniref:HD domain-containing phosphohydrolase n=1 Tax=Sulfuricurvum sp. TaxID=2025608 RepID=UPI002636B799|nr:HD domain-containing phosphohydrolase [Sulfuricurvum sp.]MDD2368419.1 response regulator [Sulfuricurvum sp.]MDD2950596.1 response regulator [Sulfuricurvum sp.]MDD5119145.1 response regulator [Sulfuricurvum sp.]